MRTYKNPLSVFTLAALAIYALTTTRAHVEAQGVYEYDWIGGSLGYSGRIFLNAPSSASAPDGGTVADVLAGSYLTTPLGNYPILDTALSLHFGGWPSSLQWDQTGITAMYLFFDSTNVILDPSYYDLPSVALADVRWYDVQNGLEVAVVQGSTVGTGYANDDFSGQWLSVQTPEPTTSALAGLGVGLALSFSFFKRSNRDA